MNIGIGINKAILHILDFNSDVCVFSQKELDFSNDSMDIDVFVLKHIEKSFADPSQKQGELLRDKTFASKLGEYIAGELSFVEFSVTVANALHNHISKSENPDPTDLMLVDFSVDSTRYLGALLLTNKIAYTHNVLVEDGVIQNEIIKHKAILPGIAQQIDSFAIVNTANLTVGFVDKKRIIDGEEILVLPELLLQCTSSISAKEAIKTVTKISAKIAEDHGANSAVVISKAKAYLTENAEKSATLSPIQLGREIFKNSDVMAKAFETKATEAGLATDIKVEKNYAIKAGRNHKIKTDTGIEITFPAEYFENPQYLEFINNPDGTISIAVKNIGKIVNR